MDVRPVDITDTDAVVAALDGADLLWLETPTNPLLGVADLPVLVGAAHDAGALVCLDATFSTPLVLRGLDHGVDVVMHSATKYLGGHSDLLMGVLVTRDAALDAALRARRDTHRRGARRARDVPGAARAAHAGGADGARPGQRRASSRAAWPPIPAVTRVRYPGLADDPGHERASRLQTASGRCWPSRSAAAPRRPSGSAGGCG